MDPVLLKLFHDINNKLTYIVCSAESLIELQQTQQNKEKLKSIQDFAMLIFEQIKEYQKFLRNNVSDEICENISWQCVQDGVNCRGDESKCRLRKQTLET